MARSRSWERITIADVALRAGLSTATVSRVINRTGPVSQAVTQRVNEAIAELHFVPHLAARQLARRKTNMLGLVLDGISGDFFSSMLRGIEAGAYESAYDLLISTTRDNVSVIGNHNADGVIIFAQSLDLAELNRLQGTGFPMVLLCQSPPKDLSIPYVAFENKAGARTMTDHLIEGCGYRHIAFLRGPEKNEDSYWREKGYRESHLHHGLVVDEALVGRGEFNENAAFDLVRTWLANGLSMDAIFAGDDESAIGSINAIKEAGLRVPEDVAVVGFDDISSARYLTPALTTVRAPIEQTAYLAVKQLTNLIEGKPVEAAILLPTELVIRESCGFRQRNTEKHRTDRLLE